MESALSLIIIHREICVHTLCLILIEIVEELLQVPLVKLLRIEIFAHPPPVLPGLILRLVMVEQGQHGVELVIVHQDWRLDTLLALLHSRLPPDGHVLLDLTAGRLHRLLS